MDSETQGALQKIRNLNREEVGTEFKNCIPTDRAPSLSFWSAYNREQVSVGQRSCLLLWVASKFSTVLREFQIQSTIALTSGKDVLIDAGTGYGKTFCMILPCLLCPETITVIISPLKRLQAVQVLEFERYGIKTAAINQDTPNDPILWKVPILSSVLTPNNHCWIEY
jgi:Rad3-related DNA helicase